MSRLSIRRTAVLVAAALSCQHADDGSAPTVHTTGLSVMVDLPSGGAAERWVMLPRGSDSWLSVGPTDYQVYACVSLDATGWGALESKTGPPTKRAVINVPDAVAAKLFDEASLGALTRDGGVCKVEGPVFDLSALTKMPYRGTAVRSGDSLLVYLSST